jgi:hypothetical protein
MMKIKLGTKLLQEKQTAKAKNILMVQMYGATYGVREKDLNACTCAIQKISTGCTIILREHKKPLDEKAGADTYFSGAVTKKCETPKNTTTRAETRG